MTATSAPASIALSGKTINWNLTPDLDSITNLLDGKKCATRLWDDYNLGCADWTDTAAYLFTEDLYTLTVRGRAVTTDQEIGVVLSQVNRQTGILESIADFLTACDEEKAPFYLLDEIWDRFSYQASSIFSFFGYTPAIPAVEIKIPIEFIPYLNPGLTGYHDLASTFIVNDCELEILIPTAESSTAKTSTAKPAAAPSITGKTVTPRNIYPGTEVTITVTGTDLDENKLSINTSGIFESSATVTSVGDNRSLIITGRTPAGIDAGTYTVTITKKDGSALANGTINVVVSKRAAPSSPTPAKTESTDSFCNKKQEPAKSACLNDADNGDTLPTLKTRYGGK
ncbi:MAG: hypothetical protein WC890_07810 [Candidatus Margulisiibacteriota bacterium]